MRVLWLCGLLVVSGSLYGQADNLQALAKDFFNWRMTTQPATGDDIPRVRRPDGWVPDVSPAGLATWRDAYRLYRSRLDAIPLGDAPSAKVDWLLLRSAIERVRWEQDVLQTPYRNPDFYVHQTLGIVYELLLIHTPITNQRTENLIARFRSFPETLTAARVNLTDPVGPFADIARHNLEDVETKLASVGSALDKMVKPQYREDLKVAISAASDALVAYREWLNERRDSMTDAFSIGADKYNYFLNQIALMPYTPDDLLTMGRLAWERAVSFETYSLVRNEQVPAAEIFPNAAAQIEQSKADEASIRAFLEQRNILTVPDDVRHYYNRKIPAQIEPLAYMGVVDDLTGPARLTDNAVSYIPEPAPEMSFFRMACAKDPRPIIVHEGVPGHYFQMVRSWRNPNPIRRHFFDSGPNEGIGFYVEEMLLQFGLFDDRPRTRDIIYRFMRLRALRVEVDVRLATGSFDIQAAGRYLARTVPMDEATAAEEAGFFAYNPGQAISYQIGKQQIFRFLSDARLQQGADFDLRAFHDYLMVNGNVPIALLRYEYLGLEDEIEKLLP